MTKKVLIIGEYYSSNLGDGVICQSVEYLIKESNPDFEVFVSDLTGRTTFNEVQINKKTIEKKSLFTILPQITQKLLSKNDFLRESYRIKKAKNIETFKEICNQNYDVAIFAGGQLFLDYFSIPLSIHVKQLSKRNIPIIFNACGMGHIKSKLLLNKFRKSLNEDNIVSISIRDDVKSVNKKLMGNSNKKAIRSYDPGLWAGEVYNVVRKEGGKVGLGVININSNINNKIVHQYRNIILELNRRNVEWELFCNGNINDYNVAVEIAHSLNYDESIIADRPQTPKELVELISTYRGIISFRLHSHIVAVSLNIPSIALSWDNKLDHFFEGINCKDRCFNIEDNYKDIVKKFFEAEAVGYEEDLILSQKKYSKDLLLKNMEMAFNNNIG